LALLEVGRNEEALASLDKVIELDSSFDVAWHKRRIVLMRLGRHEEALASIDICVHLSHADNRALTG
jgi:tetratricopeptide (TPR) repeat protein